MAVNELLGPRLPDAVLARRRELAAKPEAVSLPGERVVLRPYERRDCAELHEISNGEPVTRLGRTVHAYDPEALIWRFMPAGPFGTADELSLYQDYVAQLPDARSLVVEDRSNGELLGSVSLLANEPLHLKVEIGAVWYTPPGQKTGVNGEVTRLILGHAFRLGYQRVEWKCHAGNERSRSAALRIGFRFEGVQQHHMVQKNRHRDTAWFRILRDEWPPASSMASTHTPPTD